MKASVELTHHRPAWVKFAGRKKASLPPRVCFSAPLTERGSMCFSGCQDCLAVQCKQIAASIPVSQHLPSPVIQLEVLACTICSCAAIQLQCDAEAAEKRVEYTVRWKLYCSYLKSKGPVFLLPAAQFTRLDCFGVSC